MNFTCPVCGSRDSTEVLRASRQPAMLNRLHETKAAALKSPAVDLHFRMCEGGGGGGGGGDGCGFVWNVAFDPDSVAYAPGYINDQSHSPAFRSHLDQVRERLASLVARTPGDILEIGCGQGDFLRSLCAATRRRSVGFDPAFTGDNDTSSNSLDESRNDGAPNGSANAFASVRIRSDVFDRAQAMSASDAYGLVICRHVFEHLPQPEIVVRQVAALLLAANDSGSHSHTIENVRASRTRNPSTNRAGAGHLYIEVPCVEWIVRNGAFFDLFNEHCSLFSHRSLDRLLREAGFTDVRIEHAFGRQYLAAVAGFGAASRSAMLDDPHDTIDANRTRRILAEARERLVEDVLAERAARTCLIWGAGAKGVSLVNHLGIDDRQAPCLIDIHPHKRGRFVPVTAQRVIAPEEIAGVLGDSQDALILIMNPNYEAEVRRQLRDLGVRAEIRVVNGGPRVALHR